MKPKQYLIGAACSLAVSVMVVGCAGKSEEEGKRPTATVAPSVLTVGTVQLEESRWPQTISANGALSAWQEVIVSPETGGYRITELLVDVGAKVQRGQLLARLADASLQADLRKQEATVAQAQANLEQATSNLKRAALVEGSGALSDQKIEEYRITQATSRASLDSAKADLDSTRLKLSQTHIVAPDAGVISSKSAILGNVISTGTEMYRMVRQGKVEWRAEFDARQLTAIHEGDVASITLPGGEKVEGRVRLVGPTLSTSTGRGMVYVSLPPGDNIRAGVFVDGVVELASKVALTLPQSAIVRRDGRAYVYLVGNDNKVASRPVTIGRTRDGRVEITSSLDKQARVVASGGAFLSEDAQVTLTKQAAVGQGESRQ